MNEFKVLEVSELEAMSENDLNEYLTAFVHWQSNYRTRIQQVTMGKIKRRLNK